MLAAKAVASPHPNPNHPKLTVEAVTCLHHHHHRILIRGRNSSGGLAHLWHRRIFSERDSRAWVVSAAVSCVWLSQALTKTCFSYFTADGQPCKGVLVVETRHSEADSASSASWEFVLALQPAVPPKCKVYQMFLYVGLQVAMTGGALAELSGQEIPTSTVRDVICKLHLTALQMSEEWP